MANEQVGCCFLYYAVGCILENDGPIKLRVALPKNITAQINIGKEWQFQNVILSLPPYFVPLHPETGVRLGPEPPGREGEVSPGEIYTEITCLTDFYVPDTISARLRARDETALNELLTRFENSGELRSNVESACDLVARTLAIRIQRQLVMELAGSSLIAANKYTGVRKQVAKGDPQEIPSLFTVSQASTDTIVKEIAIAANHTKWHVDALALRWLIRAWSETDYVFKYLSLFIPLELVLNQHKFKRPESKIQLGRTLKRIINEYNGEYNEHKPELQSFVSSLVEKYATRPTLEERFEDLARTAGLANLEQDIRDFRHYNEIRNNIVHRAELKIDQQLREAKLNVFGLQDLTERYVSYAVFGDALVYTNLTRLNTQNLERAS